MGEWIDIDDYVRALPLHRRLRVQFWRLVWMWRLR